MQATVHIGKAGMEVRWKLEMETKMDTEILLTHPNCHKMPRSLHEEQKLNILIHLVALLESHLRVKYHMHIQ